MVKIIPEIHIFVSKYFNILPCSAKAAFSVALTHYFVVWRDLKLSCGSSDTCKFQAWPWNLQLVGQNCHLPKINWCFLTKFPMQWNRFFDWCLGYHARIEWVPFISCFRLVHLLYYLINFIWCNKKKPSHTLKIIRWNRLSQSACLLYFDCQQRWRTGGISLMGRQL